MTRAQAAPQAHPAALHADHRPGRSHTPRRNRGDELRLRRRHFARRRRDLLVDCAAGVVLALLVFAVTAGLGIVLLMLIPVVAGLVVAALVRRGVPQRVMAAWRAWAWARVDARLSDGRPAGARDARPAGTRDVRAAGARDARPSRGALWEEVADAFPSDTRRHASAGRSRRR